MPKKDQKEIKLSGIGASPGICMGKAYLVDKEGVDVVEKYVIDEDRLQDEIKRFKTAVKKTRDELREIIKDIPERGSYEKKIFIQLEIALNSRIL